MPEIIAEIEYQNPNGFWIHSDIEPKGAMSESIDEKHRDYLHKQLDEWIDNANGTGCFYVRNKNHKIQCLTKDHETSTGI